MLFATTSGRDKLVAIDVRTNITLWEQKLPVERNVRAGGLFADESTVFVVTTFNVDAYEAITGEPKWSAALGAGSVSIISQLDSDVVRIYYGDRVYEVDAITGET